MAIFQKVKIKDYCEITSSKRISADEYVLSGVPFYRGKEISEKQKSSSDVNDALFITRERFEDIKSKFGAPREGELLLTSVGTIGNPYVVKKNEEFYFKDGNLTWFKNFKGLNSRWFYYWLLSPYGKSELNKCTIGSSQKAYTINLLYKIELEMPDEPTQSGIASVLSAYDDLIENNEKRIKVLEEMASRLYAEWFVKFKFPGHEKVKLVDSGTEFGMIPEGWQSGSMADIFDNLRIATQAGKHLIGRVYVPIEYLPRKSLALQNFADWKEAQSSLVLFEKGDILFGAMRPYFHKVSIAPFAGVTRTTCFVLRPKEKYFKSFGTLTAFSDRVVAFASGNTRGATIPYAVWDGALSNCPIVIPPSDLLNRFENIVGTALGQLAFLSRQNDRLVKMRDLLIPQLVTGKQEIRGDV